MRPLLAFALAGSLIAAAAGAAHADTVLAAKGTKIYAVMQQRLSSKTGHDGDQFTLIVKDGFFHKNAPGLAGSVIEGHIENDIPASPLHKAHLTIVLDDIKLPGGATDPLPAKLVSLKTFEPHTHHLRDAGLIVGGAVAGHMVGSHNGMHHGGLAGAAAGFALASALKSDIVVKPNTQVQLKLTGDLLASNQ